MARIPKQGSRKSEEIRPFWPFLPLLSCALSWPKSRPFQSQMELLCQHPPCRASWKAQNLRGEPGTSFQHHQKNNISMWHLCVLTPWRIYMAGSYMEWIHWSRVSLQKSKHITIHHVTMYHRASEFRLSSNTLWGREGVKARSALVVSWGFT